MFNLTRWLFWMLIAMLFVLFIFGLDDSKSLLGGFKNATKESFISLLGESRFHKARIDLAKAELVRAETLTRKDLHKIAAVKMKLEKQIDQSKSKLSAMKNTPGNFSVKAINSAIETHRTLEQALLETNDLHAAGLKFLEEIELAKVEIERESLKNSTISMLERINGELSCSGWGLPSIYHKVMADSPLLNLNPYSVEATYKNQLLSPEEEDRKKRDLLEQVFHQSAP